MVLEELESTLPNGLHDAEIERIAVDDAVREFNLKLQCGLAAWITTVRGQRGYKKGRSTFRVFTFW